MEEYLIKAQGRNTPEYLTPTIQWQKKSSNSVKNGQRTRIDMYAEIIYKWPSMWQDAQCY